MAKQDVQWAEFEQIVALRDRLLSFPELVHGFVSFMP